MHITTSDETVGCPIISMPVRWVFRSIASCLDYCWSCSWVTFEQRFYRHHRRNLDYVNIHGLWRDSTISLSGCFFMVNLFQPNIISFHAFLYTNHAYLENFSLVLLVSHTHKHTLTVMFSAMPQNRFTVSFRTVITDKCSIFRVL
jgi:hypothetical protein